MIGSNFMLKTMVALFSVPLMAQANIVDVDLQPVKQFIAKRSSDVTGIETAQIRAAVQTLKLSARMDAEVTKEPEDAHEKTDRQHLAELLAAIDQLSKQAEKPQ